MKHKRTKKIEWSEYMPHILPPASKEDRIMTDVRREDMIRWAKEWPPNEIPEKMNYPNYRVPDNMTSFAAMHVFIRNILLELRP